MAVENTVPSLIGGVVIVKDKLGTWTLGDRTIEGNDIASAILKVGVIFIIFAIVTIAISIDKPYLDFILDDLSSNLNSHDLHLLNQNILESKDVHGGRSSISIILSFVLLICLFACVLSSDWLFKFEYSANTAAFVVFNLMSFTLMIFAFSHYEGKKFVENSKDEFKSEGFKYIPIDSLNHSSLLPIKDKIKEFKTEKNELKLDKKKAQEHKSLWIKRQGIKDRIILHGRKGLQKKVDYFQEEIDSINNEISKTNKHIAKAEVNKENKVTALHWKDLQLNNEFNSELSNHKIIGGVMALPTEFALLGFIKMFLGLIGKGKSKPKRKAKPKPKQVTGNKPLRLKSRFNNLTKSINVKSMLPKWITNPEQEKKEVERFSKIDNTNKKKPTEKEEREKAEVKKALSEMSKVDDDYLKACDKLRKHKYGEHHTMLDSMMDNGLYVFKDKTDGTIITRYSEDVLADMSVKYDYELKPLTSHYNTQYVKKLKPLKIAMLQNKVNENQVTMNF